MISKDGKNKRRKSPEKAFVSSDVYTVRPPTGERQLVIEDTLADIEREFARLIEHKIKKQYTLDFKDKATLCVFAAAMFARVDTHGMAHVNLIQKLHEKVMHMEETHNAEPRTSRQMAAMLENARPKYVSMALQMLPPLYYDLAMAILVASGPDFFITSDSPTVWHNPDAYKFPPFWRSPGLAHDKVEVTMPLTPRHLLFLSHNEKMTGYKRLAGKFVQELNRRTRFYCDQLFVSWQGEVRESWFEVGTPPDDRWENTADGRRATEQRHRLEERMKDHERMLPSHE